MLEGVAARQSVGARCSLPGILGVLAEAQAKAGDAKAGLTTLAKALALVEETDERYFEAELHRLRGVVLSTKSMQDGDAEAIASLRQAESSFQHAIELARRQQAKSWELRAAISLARLWQQQHRTDEARQVLTQVYDWFSEGFHTPDLIEAQTLLDELSVS